MVKGGGGGGGYKVRVVGEWESKWEEGEGNESIVRTAGKEPFMGSRV